jgi:Fe-Mn family superoxide dismutase
MKNELSSQPDRREFIKAGSKAGLAAGLSLSVLPALAKGPHRQTNPYAISFQQEVLPYPYTAFEPYIDAMTMEIHYTKHAATYAKNLSDACAAEQVNQQAQRIEDLLAGISRYSPKMRNNAGGHFNHELFWRMMKPQSAMPERRFAAAITRDFGSFEAFKNQFADAAKGRFGSGFAWLIVTADRKLAIGSTPNQDNPIMDVSEFKGFPVLGLDVWEHAYYLKYQNRRADYITAWFNIVNWEYVSKRFEEVA